MLWIAIAATVAAFARRSRVAAWLLVPYLAWVTFALALNAAIWRRNRSEPASHSACRAASRLAHEAVVTADRPHPAVELEPSLPGESAVVLAGRATGVPYGADTSGMQRTLTVTRRRALSGRPAPDLGF